jgi:hypothetical protein
MRQITLMERLGEALDPPTPGPAEEVRGRLQAEIAGRKRRFRLRRPVLGAGGRIAVAGGLAVVLTLAGLAVQTLRVGDRAVPTANAAEILRRAAEAALAQPDLAPRPDQFVFVEALSRVHDPAEFTDGKPRPVTVYRTQQWTSADGTRQGMTRGWMESGPATPALGTRRWTKPMPADPARRGYDADLPTEPDAMIRYLNDRPLPADFKQYRKFMAPEWLAFTAATALLKGYVPPRSLAALYQAMSRIPGITAVPDATDAKGRHGVALRQVLAEEGDWSELILDPHTYALLGLRSTTGNKTSGAPRPPVEVEEYVTAMLRIAVVDRVGKLP